MWVCLLPQIILGSYILLILICVGIGDYRVIKKRDSKMERKCKRKEQNKL